MKKAILFLILTVLAIGCSSDEDGNASEGPVVLKLSIDGVEMNYPNNSPGGFTYNVHRKGDKYTLNASYGDYGNADSTFSLAMTFTSSGKFISGKLDFNSVNSVDASYANFIYFPSNYGQTTNFSIDETNKKIKFKFSGKLYADNRLITSDSRDIQGEVNMTYIDEGEDPFPIVINNIEQYCRANINAAPWFARFEHSFSSFTDEGAYKIETNFANSPTPGSYNFTSASTSNYVKFSKFNPVTMVYDYYNVNGVVAYTYREYHGFTYYSFIGTFSFTATNPNNPADVIQVTDGAFRSYQQF